jgi:phosphate starvation-inducible PhoH-like protein
MGRRQFTETGVVAGKSTRNSSRRAVKVEKQVEKPPIKEKFKAERQLPPLVAATAKQKEYIKYLKDPSIQVVVCLGFHGTGKTFVASTIAADALRNNEIEKIIVARPYVQTGKTAGFRPGTTLMKLYPYVRNMLDTIKGRIGAAAYQIALDDGLTGAIEVQDVESIRGRSFDQPSFLIIDEAQQTTPEEMLSIVTRISDRCVLVLCGDLAQKDIQGQSGMEWFLHFASRHQLPGVAVVDFNSPDDIVRGGFVRDVAIGMMKDKEKQNEQA